MNYRQALLRRQILKALAAMGAGLIPIQRQETDANGVPQGKPAVIGCLYGAEYTGGGSGGGLHIALPGVIAGENDSRRFVGVLHRGQGPRQGDRLMIDPKGAEVLKANCRMGVAYFVTIGGG